MPSCPIQTNQPRILLVETGRFGCIAGNALNINLWTNEEDMTWKQSQLSICNAIAIAES
jgi:hypothetical protein